MINLKLRLIVMQFIEYFIWGSWLISLSGYLYVSMGATNIEIGSIYAMMGIASIITPPIFGMIADKWIHSERFLGICRFIGAISLYFASKAVSYSQLWVPMTINALIHMPALSLNSSVCYSLLSRSGQNTVEAFPPIRLWGTVGFICAMWTVNFLGWTKSSHQLLLAAAASLISSIYVFTLPSSPFQSFGKTGWKTFFGLDTFVLFKRNKMGIFFIFSLLLGICSQINNTWGSPFLEDFRSTYPNSLTIKYPLILLSISQISESFAILTIPFFLRKYGIKKTMLLSCSAYTLRFGLFAIGNPQSGFIYLLLSMIMYGIAFNFFTVSSSLFIEKEAPASIRSGAQGLLMTATNGLGAIVGQFVSVCLIDYFTYNGIRNWQNIWWIFAIYSFIVGIGFVVAFNENNAEIN